MWGSTTTAKLGKALTYNEAVPGHHYQLALAVENTAMPRFRQERAFGGTAAFSEGGTVCRTACRR